MSPTPDFISHIRALPFFIQRPPPFRALPPPSKKAPSQSGLEREADLVLVVRALVKGLDLGVRGDAAAVRLDGGVGVEQRLGDACCMCVYMCVYVCMCV